jgi:hypothetical protein
MKSVLSDMFSPLISLHLYSFSHFILSHFSHCLIIFIFPLPFPTLSHFSLFFPHSHSFPFFLISHSFLISFPFPLSHFSIYFLFLFSFPKFHVIPSFPTYLFSFFIFSIFISILHMIHYILSRLSLIYYDFPWVHGLVIFPKSMFYLHYPHNAL